MGLLIPGVAASLVPRLSEGYGVVDPSDGIRTRTPKERSIPKSPSSLPPTPVCLSLCHLYVCVEKMSVRYGTPHGPRKTPPSPLRREVCEIGDCAAPGGRSVLGLGLCTKDINDQQIRSDAVITPVLAPETREPKREEASCLDDATSVSSCGPNP